MLRLVWGAMFVWVGLAESAFSFEENSGKVTIIVQLELPGEEPRPLAGVFVYVPPSKRVGQDSELGKWLQENAKPREPRVHTFAIRDKQLIPQCDIVYVGDSVRQRINKYEGLMIELFDNQEVGGLDSDYLFRIPERVPISVKAVAATDCRPAKILVSDHTVNSITDKNGIVEFLNLPKIEKLPFQIYACSEDGRNGFQYSSSTIAIARSRFELDTRGATQEHTIRVVPKGSQK
jgi:hypothetical protein